MELWKFQKQQTDVRFAGTCALLTNEELVYRAIGYGREMNFEKYLLPQEREELQSLKREILSRLQHRTLQ